MPHSPWPPTNYHRPLKTRIKIRFRRLSHTAREKLRPKTYTWPLMNYRTRRVRGKKGWHPTDTWNLNQYLAQIIAETLEHLAVNSHGFPADLLEGATEYDPEKWEASEKAWVDWLNETAAMFRAYSSLEEDLEDALAQEKAKEALIRLSERWGSLWD